MKKTKIFFFGDSICFGQGVSIHRGWVPRVSAALDELSSELKAQFLFCNSSVNGNTTRQALERMPYDIQSHRPDYLIVQFGMNDCNFWVSDCGHQRVSPKAFSANLEEIIERALIFGARQVFLNTNHPTLKPVGSPLDGGPSYQESNARYNELIREVAVRFDEVKLTDVEKIFDEHLRANGLQLRTFLLEDGLHLDVNGHNLYYDSLYPKLAASIRTDLSRSGARE